MNPDNIKLQVLTNTGRWVDVKAIADNQDIDDTMKNYETPPDLNGIIANKITIHVEDNISLSIDKIISQLKQLNGVKGDRKKSRKVKRVFLHPCDYKEIKRRRQIKGYYRRVNKNEIAVRRMFKGWHRKRY